MNTSMNTTNHFLKNSVTMAILAVLLSACSNYPAVPDGASKVRSKLALLQSDPNLATRAPVAIGDAANAVHSAEQPQKDSEQGKHLVYLADRKIDIATARAQAKFEEDQRKMFNEQRQSVRLDSRTQEADKARIDANNALLSAKTAQQKNQELQAQIKELNAKPTERGLVLTLGDLLFATGKSNLTDGASAHLNKLATFLNQQKDRNVAIEGHTDNMGSESFNMNLSQKRAQAVKSYLVAKGVESNRIETTGIGESTPIADNNSAEGRTRNRRVEVIVSNIETSSK